MKGYNTITLNPATVVSAMQDFIDKTIQPKQVVSRVEPTVVFENGAYVATEYKIFLETFTDPLESNGT